MIGVAVGVAAAATVASTALSATSAGRGGGGGGGPVGPGVDEVRAQRRARDVLFNAQDWSQRGAFEQNLVTPDIYRQAGYDVEVDEASNLAAQESRGRADVAGQRWDAARARLDMFTKAGVKEQLAGLRGGERKRARRSLKQEKKAARRERNLARTALDTSVEAAGSAESRAGRVTGLKYRGVGDETDRELDRILGERALSAARTGESTDPRLNRELAESEGSIRARLSRQFGADYENTSAGAMALNAFRQRKAESLADFARKDIGYEDVRLGHRAALADIAGRNIGLILQGPGARFSNATQLQNTATSFEQFKRVLSEDRLGTAREQRERSNIQYQQDQARTQAITGGLNRLGSAAGGYAGALAFEKSPNTMGANARSDAALTPTQLRQREAMRGF